MNRQSRPVLASLSPGPSVLPLDRIPLLTAIGYDERWLQVLIDACPSVLPIAELEPHFWPAVPCCMELPLPSGYVDNILVTPLGDLVLIECKLWKNVDSRRRVVAQVIDYAKDLQRLSFEEFERAIGRARKELSTKLYNLVCGEDSAPLLDEAGFVDAVAKNLRRGRCLLLVVGDGISENLEAMSDYLQQNAGLHFALALVRLSLYRLPEAQDRVLVVPSIPMRTTSIVRGIVQVGDGKISVSSPPEPRGSAGATSLTEEEFLSGLDKKAPGTSERLVAFLRSCEDLQLTWRIARTMLLKMTVGDLEVRPFAVTAEGLIDTGYLSWFQPQSLLLGYATRLAAAIPGTEVRRKDTSTVVRHPDRWISVWEILDNHAGVRAALEELHGSLRREWEARSSDGSTS